MQSRLTERLAGPEFTAFLRCEVLAQDAAVAQLAQRLRVECLTRPLDQPVRVALLGSPATGKSMTTTALARWLGFAHQYIDAGSMPSLYQANAALLGSGRGLVGSNRRGVLEEAAMAPGIVVEVADLDHAANEVRAGLADLFLGLLELGQGQSAKGPKFSAAGMVIVFTLNLPGGRDERLHRAFGFGDPPGEGEVLDTARDELGQLFSQAFLSRIGSPVVYASLSGDALGEIVHRAVSEGIAAAAQRLGDGAIRVEVSAAAARSILARHRDRAARHGARALLEASRAQAVEIYLTHREDSLALGTTPSVDLLVDLRAGELLIKANHPQ